MVKTSNVFDALGNLDEDPIISIDSDFDNGFGNMDKQASATIDSFSSPGTTPIVEKINKLESQLIERKLVLLGDDGKPLPMQKANVENYASIPSSSNASPPCISKSTPNMVKEGKNVGNPFSNVGDIVISDSDDDKVLDDFNETSNFMAFDGSKCGSRVGMRSLLEQWKEDIHDQDPYDDDEFDDCSRINAQMKFANDYYISLRGQIR